VIILDGSVSSSQRYGVLVSDLFTVDTLINSDVVLESGNVLKLDFLGLILNDLDSRL